MNDIQSQLEAIQVGNGFNAFQVLFWLLVAWAVWMFFGDKIKVWFRSFAASPSLGGTLDSPNDVPAQRGALAVHAMLVANGFTVDEADALVKENFVKIRQANEAAK